MGFMRKKLQPYTLKYNSVVSVAMVVFEISCFLGTLLYSEATHNAAVTAGSTAQLSPNSKFTATVLIAANFMC